VVFITMDLHWSMRVLGEAVALRTSCKIVTPPAQLSDALGPECRLALIDLGMPALDLSGSLAAIRAAAPAARVVAFGPHVDEDLLKSAQQAGCDLVLPKSQFHKRYSELVRDAAEG
jgi:DNA-binding NarL/FixJ family response regulator